jgi:hypothetical protein
MYRDFEGEWLAEDDLSLATLKHRKNDNCTYNLCRYLERLKEPDQYDHFKIRSDFTEHQIQNNNNLTLLGGVVN